MESISTNNAPMQQVRRGSIHSGKIELTRGEHLEMRMWVAEASDASGSPNQERRLVNQAEVCAYCVEGEATLHIGKGRDQVAKHLVAGSAWTIAPGTEHK